MEIKNTTIEGCYTIKPKIFEDERGYFFESFNQKLFEETINQKINFVQDNQSFSTKGVLRGLHFQNGNFAQAKLVRVLQGHILDVVVDLRPESETFGNIFSINISDKNKMQLFIPRGCAHGFITLSTEAIFFYKCDNYYNQASETGLLYNDEFLNIDWQIPESELIISDKDLVLPTFKQLYKANFIKA